MFSKLARPPTLLSPQALHVLQPSGAFKVTAKSLIRVAFTACSLSQSLLFSRPPSPATLAAAPTYSHCHCSSGPSPHMPSHLLPNVQLPSLQHSHCTPHFRQPKCVSIVGTTWASTMGTTWGVLGWRGDDDVGTTTTTTRRRRCDDDETTRRRRGDDYSSSSRDEEEATMRRRHSGGDERAGSRCITAASQVHQAGRRKCAGPGGADTTTTRRLVCAGPGARYGAARRSPAPLTGLTAPHGAATRRRRRPASLPPSPASHCFLKKGWG